jgi:putative endonuclease
MHDSSSETKANRSRAPELERLGYSIIERNYRIRSGEIDIVADDAGTVVFVEVKDED